MKNLKTLHLASFDGNIGDNANHFGFYKYLNKFQDITFEIHELEIREFYWKERFFDESFVNLVNQYDLLIIGGGNYFELWVEDSPTGTSIAITLELLAQIKTPLLFNALGVDSGQGASSKNLKKFKSFLDLLIKRDDFISIRNDGASATIEKYLSKSYLKSIHHTPDAGFFIDVQEPVSYYKDKKYVAINIANDMPETRFKDITYQDYLENLKIFISSFVKKNPDYEIVFVPHIYRDIGAINDLLEILEDKDRRRKISIAPLLHGRDSFLEVMQIYKGAQLVLANRFHANACAIGLGVRTICLINYKQIRELCREINYDLYIDVTKKDFHIPLLDKTQKHLKISTEIFSMDTLNNSYESYMKNIHIWMENTYKLKKDSNE